MIPCDLGFERGDGKKEKEGKEKEEGRKVRERRKERKRKERKRKEGGEREKVRKGDRKGAKETETRKIEPEAIHDHWSAEPPKENDVLYSLSRNCRC